MARQGPRGSRRNTKGVTFRDADGNSSRSPAALRVAFRRLVTDAGVGDSLAITVPADAGTAPPVGPGLRDKLQIALQTANEARGGKRGSDTVDRETIRRAMRACGTLLDGEQLSELENRFDRGGTGKVNVQVGMHLDTAPWENSYIRARKHTKY